MSFSKLSFKVASAYMLPQCSNICLQKVVAKQNHLGCKKVRGQSEATLQTGMCDQKTLISAEAKKLLYQNYFQLRN